MYNVSTKFYKKTPLDSAQWPFSAEQLTVSISPPNSFIIQFEPGFNTRLNPLLPLETPDDKSDAAARKAEIQADAAVARRLRVSPGLQ